MDSALSARQESTLVALELQSARVVVVEWKRTPLERDVSLAYPETTRQTKETVLLARLVSGPGNPDNVDATRVALELRSMQLVRDALFANLDSFPMMTDFARTVLLESTPASSVLQSVFRADVDRKLTPPERDANSVFPEHFHQGTGTVHRAPRANTVGTTAHAIVIRADEELRSMLRARAAASVCLASSPMTMVSARPVPRESTRLALEPLNAWHASVARKRTPPKQVVSCALLAFSRQAMISVLLAQLTRFRSILVPVVAALAVLEQRLTVLVLAVNCVNQASSRAVMDSAKIVLQDSLPTDTVLTNATCVTVDTRPTPPVQDAPLVCPDSSLQAPTIAIHVPPINSLQPLAVASVSRAALDPK